MKNFPFLISLSVISGIMSGQKNGADFRLTPCPDSPNCVSSLSKDKRHSVEPLRYTGSMAEARQKLGDVIKTFSRSRIVKMEEDYLHAEFRSRILRFTDDTEFYFPQEERIIHVRSASRIGYSDLGVNRRRVEQIRSVFESHPKNSG